METVCIPKEKTFDINILLQCLIVLVFLTVFFWIYISKVIESSLNDQVDNAIRNNIPKLINYINSYDFEKINWDEVTNYVNSMDTTENVKSRLLNFVNEVRSKKKMVWNKDFFENLSKQYSGQNSDIVSSNRNLVIINIILILVVAIVFTGYVIYYKKDGYYINWKELIIENVILFAIIGVIEYLFFTRIASKYIPTSASFISASMIDSVKNQLIDDQNDL